MAARGVCGQRSSWASASRLVVLSLLRGRGDGLVEIVCNTIGPLDLKAVVSKRCERRCRQPRGCQMHARSGTCSLVQAKVDEFPVVAIDHGGREI